MSRLKKVTNERYQQDVNTKIMEQINKRSTVIAGASLAGLMTGILLSGKGFQVDILERSGEKRNTGAVLQVDHGDTDSTPEARFIRRIASAGKKKADAWMDIELRLRKYAESDPNIKLKYNTKVVEIGQDDKSAWLITDTGERVTGNLVVGADGYRSTVRKKVAPHHPDATYAGYLIWLTLLPEKVIPQKHRFGKDAPILSIHDERGDLLLGAMLTGPQGETTPGDRRIGFGWYDNTINEMLQESGCISGSIVNHSLYAKDISEKQWALLEKKAIERWPHPWLYAALQSIRTRNLIGIPVAEYLPDKLVSGKIVLVGDAAHLSTPMAANGFNAALEDAVTLANCMEKNLNNGVETALRDYESRRLKVVRNIVNSGRSFSQSFGSV